MRCPPERSEGSAFALGNSKRHYFRFVHKPTTKRVRDCKHGEIERICLPNHPRCRGSDKLSSTCLAPSPAPKGFVMRALFVMCLIVLIPLSSSTVFAGSDHSGSSEKLGTV